MLRHLLISFLLVCTSVAAFATHNRAGEITYRHLGGLSYEITITTYTKASSTAADRCELEIRFGDLDLDTIQRVNGPAGDCAHMGQIVGGANDLKKNIYITTHTYPGPGSYIISLDDPNRNADIINVPNSVNTSFYLESELIINPFTGDNNSPILENPPIDNGCVGKRYEHNPGASDPDGDVLQYTLIAVRGEGGSTIDGFMMPSMFPQGQGNNITLELTTGTLVWQAPQVQGEYNIAILIEEFRDGALIGSVVRDMQITIGVCENDPPVIEKQSLICVTAGDTLDLEIYATDPNQDLVLFSATGEPLNLPVNPATFAQVFPQVPDTAWANFHWVTKCDDIRQVEYQLVIKATDNDSQNSLVDFETVKIKVVGPPPLDPGATPLGNSLILDWSPPVCTNVTGYKIYRNIDSVGYVPDLCQTGVPSSTGYTLIDSTSSTGYEDSDQGEGLTQGQRYCYMITACYPDGSEGFPTPEFCGELKKDLPVVTRVSVNTTRLVNGSDTVEWSMPTEIDTMNAWPPPYMYKLFRSNEYGSATEEIRTIGPSQILAHLDTIVRDSMINTADDPHTYRVELYSNGNLVGSSKKASSIYLSSESFDNALELSWEVQVPWFNSKYVVYRFDNVLATWEVLDTVTTRTYRDANLVNGREYCYWVRSIGRYSASGYIDPIINNSQEHCGIPADLEAPCRPDTVHVASDCETGENLISWNNPNNTCADDVIGYRVYWTPILNGTMQVIGSTNDPRDTTYFQDGLISVAGCYAIAAVDSFLNESVLSDTFCVDNCPEYELPNVFTPGGDGFNDFFVPFPYRNVERIDLRIVNRWGQEMFRTKDPAIRWDGRIKGSNDYVPDGVYYYVCTVFERRLTGIEERRIASFVHVLNQPKRNPTQ